MDTSLGSELATTEIPRGLFAPPTPDEVRLMTAREGLDLIMDQGASLIERLRQLHAPNEGIKTVRTFRIQEASALIGRSPQWLRDTENNETFKGKIGSKDAGNWRRYSLEDINILRDFAGTRPGRKAGDPMRVISMLNFKGGAAKTTTCHLFAHFLATAGYRILLVDMDPQGSLTTSFDIFDAEGHVQHSFGWDDCAGPILTGEADDLRPIIRATHWPTIDIVPAAIDVYDAELKVASKTQRDGVNKADPFWLRLQNALRKIDEYDLVLIDSAPALSFGLINAYMASDGVIVPTPALVIDLDAVVKFAEVVSSWIDQMDRLAPGGDKWLRLVFSKFMKGSETEQTCSQMARATFGSLVLNHPLPAVEAIKRGVGGAPSPYEGSSAGLGRSVQTANLKVREQLEDTFRELRDLIEASWGRTA